MSHEVNPLFLFKEHTAAVKAVSWCPWQSNVLGIYYQYYSFNYRKRSRKVTCNIDKKIGILAVLNPFRCV